MWPGFPAQRMRLVQCEATRSRGQAKKHLAVLDDDARSECLRGCFQICAKEVEEDEEQAKRSKAGRISNFKIDFFLIRNWLSEFYGLACERSLWALALDFQFDRIDAHFVNALHTNES